MPHFSWVAALKAKRKSVQARAHRGKVILLHSGTLCRLKVPHAGFRKAGKATIIVFTKAILARRSADLNYSVA